MAYDVPQLPYDYDALEPQIGAETMRVHHDRHHQAYVDKANAALAGTAWADASPEELLQRLDELPEELRTTVRNNAGGHYNHSLFWRSMSPDGGGEPSGGLGDEIDRAFGSFQRFKDTLKEAAVSTFGSGWAWLAHDGTRLLVVATSNQDNPVIDGLTPLLGLDVWEHAYYLDYENRRPDYVDAWFNVVDWSTVAQRFADVPKPDVSEILVRSVSIAGAEKDFGEITVDDANKQAAELKALTGWGPMAKVGSVARGWSELAKLLNERGAQTVAELDPILVAESAKRLWIIPPDRSMA